MSQKAVKGSAIADFIASRAVADYEPLSFDFPDEELMCIQGVDKMELWYMAFDGAPNAIGNGIGAVLVSPDRKYYPLTARLEFECTNNVAEYEACILGIQKAIERGVKRLLVYGDSALVIYQLRGEWETKDPKLAKYRKMIMKLIKEFDKITFHYQPR